MAGPQLFFQFEAIGRTWKCVRFDNGANVRELLQGQENSSNRDRVSLVTASGALPSLAAARSKVG